MLRKFIKVIGFIIFILALFIIRLLINSGFFKSIENQHNGKTLTLNGIVGAEDITVDYQSGIAYISADDRRNPDNKGNIYAINLNEPTLKLINLTQNSLLEDFHPHGISLLQLPDGRKQLYVVNHRVTTGNMVEIFDIKDSTLELKESISDDLFISPNDILAVAEGVFYITNDHDEPLRKSRRYKDLLQIPMGNVVYFDKKKAKIVADDLLYANGINKIGNKIFVAETTNRKINVYSQNTNNGELTQVDEIKIDGADNIEITPDGKLWVGTHPKLLNYLKHGKDSTQKSPSMIVSFKYEADKKPEMKEVFVDDGKLISGSSVGIEWKNKLLIGSVFEPKLIVVEK